MRVKGEHIWRTVPKHVPIEMGRNGRYNPNSDGNCSAYATRIAENFFGKKFARANAWGLGLKNKIVLESVFDRKVGKSGFSKNELVELIKTGRVRPGTIIGVFYSGSKHNKPGRNFTHAMVFVGKNFFWHNFDGPKRISLNEIFSAVNKKGERLFFPVQVIEPK